MNSNYKLLLLIPLCLYAIGTSHAGWFGPNNYNDCILENIKGVTQIQAIHAVKSSCRSKFPQACYAWKKKVNSQYKIGWVYKGYRFKGGDSTDLKNWDKAPKTWAEEFDAVGAEHRRVKVKEAPSGDVFDELDVKYGVNQVDHELFPIYRDTPPAPEGCEVVLSK